MEKYYHIVGEPTSKEANSSVTDNYLRVSIRFTKGKGYELSIRKAGKFCIEGAEMVSIPMCITKADEAYLSCIVPCSRRSKKRKQEAETYAERFAGEIIRDYFPKLKVEVI